MNDRSPASEDAARRRHRFRGALLGVIVGDALGSPWEGHRGSVPVEVLPGTDLTGTTLRHTDDTALTFALADSLLCRGQLDLDHVAAAFADAYRREPDRGYGGAAAQLLHDVADGADWRIAASAQFGGQGSFGNGAAMRVAPAALYAGGSVEAAVRLGRASATVTHTHLEAVDAAGVQAAAVALALGDGPANSGMRLVEELLRFAATARLRAALERILRLPAGSAAAHVAAVTGTGVAAVEAVPAAVAASSLHPDSFAATIRFAIGLGGDTDTIAAMAGAIVGARLGEGAIPVAWVDKVEGAAEARQLADRLAACHDGEDGGASGGRTRRRAARFEDHGPMPTTMPPLFEPGAKTPD